jgi:hypothetical protein
LDALVVVVVDAMEVVVVDAMDHQITNLKCDSRYCFAFGHVCLSTPRMQHMHGSLMSYIQSFA